LAQAAERTSPVTVDGRIDEAAWARVEPVGDFTQSDPNEGEPATQRTEVCFLFDDDALNVGVRMFDSEGATPGRSRPPAPTTSCW
jgi:hypothetical protein